MVERFYRMLRAARKFSTQSWLDALLLVMLDFRNAFKYNLKASLAEMVYSTTLRTPGEFFYPNLPALD